jgi:hypothetical protein
MKLGVSITNPGKQISMPLYVADSFFLPAILKKINFDGNLFAFLGIKG